jgi:allantoin racemase
MADLAEALSTKFEMPVVDGVAAAVKQAEALIGLRLKTSRRGAYATPGAKIYTGLLKDFAPQ